jgi:hypothetical protein
MPSRSAASPLTAFNILTGADTPASIQLPHGTLDVLSWLTRATLDVIGLAGFGYSFDALEPKAGESNELADAFSVIFSAARKFRIITVLQVWFPFLRRFVSYLLVKGFA